MRQTLEFFKKLPGVDGGFVSGSVAAGGMDEYSDLDLGFLVADRETRERLWRARWDWSIAPWFHRFDADHIKPYFVIYFFEPAVHVDLNFYVAEDLPGALGAPFKVAWDRSGRLDAWASEMNRVPPATVDWNGAVHDDERFWAWIHYCASHALRGELYDAAYFMKDLRQIVENWEARLQGFAHFSPRRAESRWDGEFLEAMNFAFGSPKRESIRRAFESLIQIQLKQRQKISAAWKTSDRAIREISAMIARI